MSRVALESARTGGTVERVDCRMIWFWGVCPYSWSSTYEGLKYEMVEAADVDGVLAATVTTDRGLAPCPSARLTPLDPRGIAHTSDCYLCALLTHISGNK